MSQQETIIVGGSNYRLGVDPAITDGTDTKGKKVIVKGIICAAGGGNLVFNTGGINIAIEKLDRFLLDTSANRKWFREVFEMAFFTSPYHATINKATGCTEQADLEGIEDYMRNTIFNSTLNWQTEGQLKKAAKEAWRDIQFMRSPEGLAYIAKLEEEMLNY